MRVRRLTFLSVGAVLIGSAVCCLHFMCSRHEDKEASGRSPPSAGPAVGKSATAPPVGREDESTLSRPTQQTERARIPSESEHAATDHAIDQVVSPAPDPQELPLFPATPPDSSDPEYLVEIAQVHMRHRAFDKAIPLLHQAAGLLQESQFQRQVRSMLFECLLRTQDYGGAESIGERFLDDASSDEERVQSAVKLAHLHALRKDFDGAERVLREAESTAQNKQARAEIRQALLRVWQQQPGRMQEVASDLERKVAQDASDTQTLSLLGTIYVRFQRDYQKAKAVYEKLAAHEPEDTQIQHQLISIYQRTEDYAKARAVYEGLLERYPENADAMHFQIASLFVKSGRGDDAVDYARLHLAADDATPDQLRLLSKVCENAGRLREAAQTLQTAEGKEPDAAERAGLQLNRVDLLMRQQKYEEAEVVIHGLLDSSPDDVSTQARAKSALVRLYQIQGRTHELSITKEEE